MNFAIINAHLPNYEALAKLTTYGNRAEYCTRHGYNLLVQTEGFDMPAYHPVSWSRFKFMRNLLASGQYDWAYCCGTDTLHTNFNIRLEDLVAKAGPEHHVIASCEWCSPIQADSFLVRHSPVGIAWMDAILGKFNQYKNDTWVEQRAIIDTLPDWAKVVKILPQRAMNSYDYSLYLNTYSGEPRVVQAKDWFGNDGQWHQGDFLIHWPGISLATRLELVKKFTPLIVK